MKLLGQFGVPYLESWTLDQWGVANATMALKIVGAEALGQYDVEGSTPRCNFTPPDMLVMRKQVAPQDGGSWAIVRWFYEGLYQETGYAEYELETTARDVPLMAHPFIYSIMKAFQGWEDDEGLHFLRILTGEAKKRGISSGGQESVNPMYGIESYIDIGAIWRKVTVQKKIPTGAPGHIVEVPPTEKKPPSLGAGMRNWLTMPIRSRKRGKHYEITEEWMLSGRGRDGKPGWNEDIYYK